jgi:hypothetical protein
MGWADDPLYVRYPIDSEGRANVGRFMLALVDNGWRFLGRDLYHAAFAFTRKSPHDPR